MLPSSTTRRTQLAAALFVAFAAAATFAPALQNGWVPWDDEALVLNNPHIRAFSLDNLYWMATTIDTANYQPLGNLSYALDYKLWGLDARGFHLTSLLLHALNAVLVYVLTLRLLQPAFGARRQDADLAAAAAFGALLFALHPLRVESVAWASERREGIAAFLYLAGLLAYLEAARQRRRRWLAASLGLITLAGATKALTITAPIILVALDWYPLRRLPADPLRWRESSRTLWLEKIPFILVSLAGAALGYITQKSGGAVWDWNHYGLAPRLAQTGYGLVFYLRKTLWPSGLSPLYAVPPRFTPWEPRFLLCWSAVAAITTLAWRSRLSKPGWLAAWIGYGALLAPVLGLSQAGHQFTADRYSYLACLGWSTLAASGWLSIASSSRPRARAAVSLGAGSVLLALALATGRQIAVWRDALSLWTRAVEVEPWSSLARNNLGLAFGRLGRLDEAAAQFTTLLNINPNCATPDHANPDRLCAVARRHLLTTLAAREHRRRLY